MQQPRYFSRQVVEARRFYLNLRQEVPGDLAVMSGGIEKCALNYDNARTNFAHSCVEFVARGVGTLKFGTQTHTLAPGTVFAYGPRLGHRITTSADAPLWKYFVVFTGADSARILAQAGLPSGSVGHIVRPERLQDIFDDLIAQGLSDHADRVRRCATVFQYLMLKIGELNRPPDEVGERSYATYERIRRHIAEHFETIACLSDIAIACGVDVAYVCRLFRRFGRESPFQYLQHLRLNRAAELLQTTDRLIKDIAAQMHFTDAFNFSRTFRNSFGVSPNEFRKKNDGSTALCQP